MEVPSSGPASAEMVTWFVNCIFFFNRNLNHQDQGTNPVANSWYEFGLQFQWTSCHQVETHWKFIMGYFASFDTLKVPNLKVHEAELVKSVFWWKVISKLKMMLAIMSTMLARSWYISIYIFLYIYIYWCYHHPGRLWFFIWSDDLLSSQMAQNPKLSRSLVMWFTTFLINPNLFGDWKQDMYKDYLVWYFFDLFKLLRIGSKPKCPNYVVAWSMHWGWPNGPAMPRALQSGFSSNSFWNCWWSQVGVEEKTNMFKQHFQELKNQ